MGDLAGLATLITAAVVSALSGFRTWRANSKLPKWGGTGLASLLSGAATVLSIGIIVGLVRLNARSASAPDIKIAGTPEQIQRGRAISDGFCSGCHSATLTGGLDLGRSFAVPAGSMVASNLTPAGQLARWSDGDIFRAIRNGLDHDGHWLIVMSYTNARSLSDDDTRAVIAYLRSLLRPARRPGIRPTSSTCWGS
jgi:mono/diheme cytochrome c family protein